MFEIVRLGGGVGSEAEEEETQALGLMALTFGRKVKKFLYFLYHPPLECHSSSLTTVYNTVCRSHLDQAGRCRTLLTHYQAHRKVSVYLHSNSVVDKV